MLAEGLLLEVCRCTRTRNRRFRPPFLTTYVNAWACSDVIHVPVNVSPRVFDVWGSELAYVVNVSSFLLNLKCWKPQNISNGNLNFSHANNSTCFIKNDCIVTILELKINLAKLPRSSFWQASPASDMQSSKFNVDDLSHCTTSGGCKIFLKESGRVVVKGTKLQWMLQDFLLGGRGKQYSKCYRNPFYRPSLQFK